MREKSIILVCAAVCGLLSVVGLAEELPPNFVSFQNGQVVWTNSQNDGNSFYQVLWSPVLTNSPDFNGWRTNYLELTHIRPDQNQTCVTSAVPMFYKILAVTNQSETEFFTLTVEGGSGSGSYTNGQQVSVVANYPAAEQVFDYWSDDVSAAEISNAVATVTMPDGPLTMTAHYRAAVYTLEVNGGTVSGSYTNGSVVSITAPEAPDHQIFSCWTGDTNALTNAATSETAAVISGRVVSVTALYTNILYTLTVTNGLGSTNCAYGQAVAIMANAPGTNQVFDAWTGDTNSLANLWAANTTLQMPGTNVSVTATYRPATYLLRVFGGSGTGDTYTNNQSVAITADPSPFFRVFDRWLGDTNQVAVSTNESTTVSVAPSNTAVMASYFWAPVPKVSPVSSDLTDPNVPWPTNRFTVGTGISSNCVVDNLTGLMWLSNPSTTLRTFSGAVSYCASLDGGEGRGGHADWRLPTLKELQSLLDFRYAGPALPNTSGAGQWVKGDPFLNVSSFSYVWSITVLYSSTSAWVINCQYGSSTYYGISGYSAYAWPVRGRRQNE